MIGTRRIRFQAKSSLIELETLDRAMPSGSAMSSAVIGASARYSRPWIWLTERLTPHSSPISPQCRMNRSTAAGNFFLPVVSVITEISDDNGWMSSGEKEPVAARFVPCRASQVMVQRTQPCRRHHYDESKAPWL